MATILSNDTKYATQVPVSLSEKEYEIVQRMSGSFVKYKQLNTVIHRIKQCNNRLQLRFPTVFRDGIIMQYLSHYIALNANIRTIACGLQSNYLPGFYALSELLALSNIRKFNFRINDLSFAPPPFFEALRMSNMKRLHLRFDDITDSNIEALCNALASNSTLKELVFGCKTMSETAVQCLGALCGDSKLERLSIAVQSLNVAQMKVICDGLERSRTISVLDVEDSTIGFQGMKVLTAALRKCGHIQSLTIGNNGVGAMQSFFEDLGGLKSIEKLSCNESQLVRAEHVDLGVVSRSLIEMNKFRKLRKLQLPLFIFETTTDDALEQFVEALSGHNLINTLQLFPLFEHLDRGETSQRGAAYNQRISHFFHMLFDGLSTSRSLRKLYIEMIGSESTFFTESVANSFYRFLTESKITELYVPFCCLVDLRADILSRGLAECTQLVSVKDDSTDYDWLDRDQTARGSSGWYYGRYKVCAAKRAEMVRAKRYHQIAHRQCQSNMTREIVKHVPVQQLAVLISTFCGFEADPEYWMR